MSIEIPQERPFLFKQVYDEQQGKDFEQQVCFTHAVRSVMSGEFVEQRFLDPQYLYTTCRECLDDCT